MLEVAADRRQALEVLDRLLATRLAARPQRRADELLEQRRLAVGGGAKDAEVAAGDAEARELGGGADDLEVGLVEDRAAVTALRLDDPVLGELPQERLRHPRLLDQLVLGERLYGGVDRGRAAGDGDVGPPPLGAGAGEVAGGELLADHAQRQELIALHPQDRPQP